MDFFYQDSIERIERMLRNVVDAVMSEEYGQDWLDSKSNDLELDLDNIKKRIAQEKGRLSPFSIPEFKINYLEFSELTNIIFKNKTLFKSVFHNIDRIEVYLKRVNDLRNTKKHHRELQYYHLNLLEGIAGEIEETINFWQIGSDIELESTKLEFTEIFSLANKNETEILHEAKERLKNWSDDIEKAIDECRIKKEYLAITRNDFDYKVNGSNFWLDITTKPDAGIDRTPNHKAITSNFTWKKGWNIEPNRFLKTINRPYNAMTFELSNNIDIDKLKKLIDEQSGFSYRDGNSINYTTNNIEYQIANGIRIQATSFFDVDAKTGGRIVLWDTTGNNTFWRLHEYIDPKFLLGIMVGLVTPRHLMKIFALAKIAFN